MIFEVTANGNLVLRTKMFKVYSVTSHKAFWFFLNLPYNQSVDLTVNYVSPITRKQNTQYICLELCSHFLPTFFKTFDILCFNIEICHFKQLNDI